FQALDAQLGDSCFAPILEPERSALIIDSQNIVHVVAVCGYSGCPGGDPDRYARSVAAALGFQHGLPYNSGNNAYLDPGEAPPPELSEEELEMLMHYFWLMTIR
ncbi:MAG: hypothetical protein K6T71_04640, partial [Candidatus Bipolaricaulota bacterium]|nr:hypothetical protein [Candidatus Bipolaricaulota bacterium]